MFGANCFGTIYFGQDRAEILVAPVVPVVPPPSTVMVGSGRGGTRRHGLTRAVPGPMVIRATCRLVQAAHECEAHATVTRLVVSASAVLVQAAAQCTSTARLIVRGKASLVQGGTLAHGLAGMNTDKLDEELAAAGAALCWLAEQEEAADLSCK